MKQRKIIQVISERNFRTKVLCDDGTIWEIDGVDGFTYSKYSWNQIVLPKIPNSYMKGK